MFIPSATALWNENDGDDDDDDYHVQCQSVHYGHGHINHFVQQGANCLEICANTVYRRVLTQSGLVLIHR